MKRNVMAQPLRALVAVSCQQEERGGLAARNQSGHPDLFLGAERIRSVSQQATRTSTTGLVLAFEYRRVASDLAEVHAVVSRKIRSWRNGTREQNRPPGSRQGPCDQRKTTCQRCPERTDGLNASEKTSRSR